MSFSITNISVSAIGWTLDYIISSTRSPKRRRLSQHQSTTSQPVSRPDSHTSQNVTVSQSHSVATQTRQVHELSQVSVKPKNPEASVSGSRNAHNSVIGYVRCGERSHSSRQSVSYCVAEGVFIVLFWWSLHHKY